ncbi:hypothetical protein HJC99_04255 [Candidatus Saccharibacteria bacterium]|nr:hypothetical protein [Candidatus Saccharibacteria bacterium]
MGFKKQSELRRAENEVIFKEYNEALLDRVNAILPEANKPSYEIAFICECSEETCQDRIELSVEQFKRLTNHPRRFILKHHHEQEDIEQIVELLPQFEVVEKFELPPSTDGVLNRT